MTKKFDKELSKIFLIRPDGKIVIQIRSDNKKLCPNCFDASAGGLIDQGETPIQGAMREMHEEIKIKTDLKQIGTSKFYCEPKDWHCKVYVFVGKIDKDIEWFDKSEVKAIEYFTLSEILARLALEKKNDNVENVFDTSLVSALESKEIINEINRII
ncbi:MAG: NUDIX domain-containing protein [Firmicutes bacterium]|nr:NUDIX domain-containing protein [Bacillota bacterium]